MKLIHHFQPLRFDYKGLSLFALVIIASNLLTYKFGLRNTETITVESASTTDQLYLLDKARPFVYDLPAFEEKVRQVSRELNIAPEWLMAVIYAELRFDASISNHKGSGALGLIQFMPTTLKSMDVTPAQLQNLNHTEQLDFTQRYLQNIMDHTRPFESLTDLYLAILYPKALGEDYCYTLYAQPTENYKQNSGLDEDKDGRVTVQDVDRRLKRIYPTAYVTPKPSNTIFGRFFN